MSKVLYYLPSICLALLFIMTTMMMVVAMLDRDDDDDDTHLLVFVNATIDKTTFSLRGNRKITKNCPDLPHKRTLLDIIDR